MAEESAKMTKEKKSMAKHMFGNNIKEINEFLVDAFKGKVTVNPPKPQHPLLKVVKKDK